MRYRSRGGAIIWFDNTEMVEISLVSYLGDCLFEQISWEECCQVFNNQFFSNTMVEEKKLVGTDARGHETG